MKITPTWSDALNHPELTFEVCVGDWINLAPHCDLWMRGARNAKVIRILEDGRLRVRPNVAGVAQRRTFTIMAHHVLAPLARLPKSER